LYSGVLPKFDITSSNDWLSDEFMEIYRFVNEVLFDVHIECILIVKSSWKLANHIVYIERYVDYLTEYDVDF
jgi:hypothetical protein